MEGLFVLLGLISAGCDKVESMEFRSMATGAVDFIVCVDGAAWFIVEELVALPASKQWRRR